MSASSRTGTQVTLSTYSTGINSHEIGDNYMEELEKQKQLRKRIDRDLEEYFQTEDEERKNFLLERIARLGGWLLGIDDENVDD